MPLKEKPFNELFLILLTNTVESQSASHLQLTIAAAVVQSALLDHEVEDTAGPEETILAQLFQWKELT